MSSEWKFENWIAASLDRLHPGRHILLGIEQWIFRERSDFQEVAIARVPRCGKGLFLDAVVEFLEIDEFVYHEAMALPPLLFHPSPKRVLIQGGGDGLALREVLRDPRVEEVVLVEIDPLVIEACREHLSELHRGSFADPRARIVVRDVLRFLDDSPPPFDVVLFDLLDGYDAASLEIYKKILPPTRNALAPGAVVGGFGDLAFPSLPIRPIYQGLRRNFAHVALHRAAIETFSGGYGFLLASDAVDFENEPSARIQERASSLDGELRSLVPAHFPSCFAVPSLLKDRLEQEPSPVPDGLSAMFSWLHRE